MSKKRGSYQKFKNSSSFFYFISYIYYMKSTFNFIITISIIYFSFYYTNLVSNYIKNKDPIMIEIKNNQDKYYKDPINAIILNNTIIPGLNGKII